jgi:4-methyl-5(b-hydroxyethyl)-thiazole monophosphate biosynthesis
MPKVVVILAEGFEEVEAMSIVDILRRANIEVVLAGLQEGPVSSARKVRVLPDTVISTVQPEDFDMLILPGGQPGSDNLNADGRVKNLIRGFHEKGKLTGAICAAPYVLANAGVLEGRRATSYPTYREKLGKAVYEEKTVVEDGNILTSRGPGTAPCFALAIVPCFALAIVERLVGKGKAEQIKEGMLLQKACD